MGNTPSNTPEDIRKSRTLRNDTPDSSKRAIMMEESSAMYTNAAAIVDSCHISVAMLTPPSTKRKRDSDESTSLSSPESSMDGQSEAPSQNNKRMRQDSTTSMPGSHGDEITIKKEGPSSDNAVGGESSKTSIDISSLEALREQVMELTEDKKYLKQKLIDSRREVETLKQDVAKRDDDQSLDKSDDALNYAVPEQCVSLSNPLGQQTRAATPLMSESQMISRLREKEARTSQELEQYRNELKDRNGEIQQLETKCKRLAQEKLDLATRLAGGGSDDDKLSAERKMTHRAYSQLHKLRKELTERIAFLEQERLRERALITSLLQDRGLLQQKVKDLEQGSKTMMAEVEQQLRFAVARHQQALSKVETGLQSANRAKLVQAQENQRLVAENQRLKQMVLGMGQSAQDIVNFCRT